MHRSKESSTDFTTSTSKPKSSLDFSAKIKPVNPLLSASVLATPLECSNLILPPEPKILVTVGKSPEFDTENLDEINLNPVPENLGPAPIIDTNSNSLEDQITQSDSLLSQAASSFSALPSVASNVFSTFSKRIYAGGSTGLTGSTGSSAAFSDLNENQNQPQQTTATFGEPNFLPPPQQQAPLNQQQNFAQHFLPPPPVQSNLSPEANATNEVTVSGPPPKLYAPTEVPILPPSVAAPPLTAAANQNTYRLSAKKKLYAPIPGLSEQAQPVATLGAINTAPTTYDSAQYNYPQHTQDFPTDPLNKPEERRGGLSYFTNLVPSGVLQNISGLVQTATGSFGQSSVKQENSTQQTFPSVAQTPLSAANFFAPPPADFQATGNTGVLGNQSAFPQPQSTAANPFGVSSLGATSFFTPIQPQAVSVPPQTAPLQQLAPQQLPTQALPSSSVQSQQLPTKEASSPSQTAPLYQLPPQIFAAPALPTLPQQFQPQQAPLHQLPSQQAPIQLSPQQQPAAQPASLQPAAPQQLPTQASAPPQQFPPPQLPQIPSGQISFRLQKGTRLYKNPLTSAEIATSHSNLQQQPLSLQQPQSYFNPLTSTLQGENTNQQLFNPYQQTQQPVFNPLVPTLPVDPPQQTQSIFNPLLPTESSKASQQEQPNKEGQQTVLTPLEHKSPTDPSPPINSSVENTLTQTPEQQQHQPIFSPLESSLPVENLQQQQQHQQPKLESIFSSTAAAVGESIPQQHEIPHPPQSIFNAFETDLSVAKSLQQQPDPSLLKSLEAESTVDLLAPQQSLTQSITNSQGSAFPLESQIESGSNFFAPQAFEVKAQDQNPPASNIQTSFNTTTSTSTTINTEKAFTEELSKPPSIPLPTLSSLPPVALPTSQAIGNPFRKAPAVPVLPASVSNPITLASFFTPSSAEESNSIAGFGALTPTSTFFDQPTSLKTDESSSNNIGNFFSQPKLETVNPEINIFAASAPAVEKLLPPAIGFDGILTESKETNLIEQPITTKEDSLFHSFVAKENQTLTHTPSLPTIPVGIAPGADLNDSTNSNEDQTIQNFFNNPPPKDSLGGIGDLNYDLVHSGLGVRTQHTGSLTTASNIVEPPSSACSEFSELNNSAINSRSLPPQNSETINIEKKSEQSGFESTSQAPEVDPLQQHYNDLPEDILKELRMSTEKTTQSGAVNPTVYSPAVKHWFYKRPNGAKYIWTPFSHYDSALLETSLIANEDTNIVAVEGGRYDVNIKERLKMPVYWEGAPIEVRRCSWFYKTSDSKYVPYEEETADRLEEEYRQAAESGVWHKKILIANNEQVVFHGPTVIVHFQQQQNVDAWGGTTQTTSRPRVVKRDLDDFGIEQGESQRVDHLLMMVHGIGSACDLKMRSVEEVVDDFRSIAQQLVQSHYKNSTDMGIVGRVEVLPISWHSHLHSEEMGIDEKLKSITLESIPKLRNFTNDTLLDVFFYTSPIYCQKIVNSVATSMNKLYMRYRERHPEFSGGVSLAGHSLGSLILFDILCHQQPIKECEEQNLENPNQLYQDNQFAANNASQSLSSNVVSQQISYTMGPAGTGQPYINYAQLVFQPKKFFALGSPIGMFVTIRGIDKLGLNFRLPTCPGFYNIFHPFDPVAYRIEALVNTDMSGIRPVLIPHHKGRKRMHLELKETMTRVGADLKQRFLDTFKTTLESVNFIGSVRSKKEAEDTMEKEVDQVIAMQLEAEREIDRDQRLHSDHEMSHAATELPSTRSRANSNSTTHSETDIVEIDFPLGKLNDAKRIDYVLQEAPLEFINEYLFALSSHVCYWDSSDTILFVMKEIYSGLGISPDSQVPQQTLTIERPNSRNNTSHTSLPPTN